MNVTLEQLSAGLRKEKQRREKKRNLEFYNYVSYKRNRTVKQRKGLK